MTASSSFRLVQFGHVCEIKLGKMLQTKPTGPHDQEVPYLRAGLLDTLGHVPELPKMFCGVEDLQTYRVREGDLLVAEGGDVGRAEFTPELTNETIFQNSLHRIRVKNSGDIRFVRYALETMRSSGWLDVLSNRTTFGHLTVEKLRQLRVPWRQASEQRTIADYLDTETARIDALISKKRRLIILLNEKARYEARTLTTEGWNSAPLRRFVSRIKTGTTPPLGQLAELKGDDLAWYSPGDTGNFLEMKQPARTLSARAIAEGMNPLFPAESTLIVGIGATAGRVGHSTESSTGNQQITCIEGNSRVLPRFLSWQLWARSDELREVAPYTTLPILNNDFLQSLTFFAPPLKAQREIADRLDQIADRDTLALKHLNRQISLLEESRSALISAAVTGQTSVAT